MSITSPAATLTEAAAPFESSISVPLDPTGVGVIALVPDNSNQRLLITGVKVTTDQAADAPVVPYAELVRNETGIPQLVAGMTFGITKTGNDDDWSGHIDISPASCLNVVFYPPPEASPEQAALLGGITATAVISGTTYTRSPDA